MRAERRTSSRAWAVVALIGGIWLSGGSQAEAAQAITFEDVERQTREFMGYQESITLTVEQEAIKREALTAIPAPCCSDNTSYTCCCPCNLARSIWGLSHVLITEHGYTAAQVGATVKEWIEFVNPSGYSGDVCYTGGCGRPFKANGCGGMSKANVVF